VALNFHIAPTKAVYVFRDLSNEPEENIISPSVHEAMKAVAAQFTAEELIAKRQQVSSAIIDNLKARLSRHGIEIDEFSILDFNFSKSFNDAIEAKTTAEQLKLKAVNDLQRIKVEAEQKVVAAKAEADSLALQKQNVTQELLQLRSIENQRAAIEKWDGRLPDVTGGATPFISVQGGK
jgi:regulator of protease activity HflC (stomatin/prohibitin superfamily)